MHCSSREECLPVFTLHASRLWDVFNLLGSTECKSICPVLKIETGVAYTTWRIEPSPHQAQDAHSESQGDHAALASSRYVAAREKQKHPRV